MLVIQLNDIARKHGLLTQEVLTLSLAAGVRPSKIGNTRVIDRAEFRDSVKPLLERFLATRATLEQVTRAKEGEHVGAVK